MKRSISSSPGLGDLLVPYPAKRKPAVTNSIESSQPGHKGVSSDNVAGHACAFHINSKSNIEENFHRKAATPMMCSDQGNAKNKDIIDLTGDDDDVDGNNTPYKDSCIIFKLRRCSAIGIQRSDGQSTVTSSTALSTSHAEVHPRIISEGGIIFRRPVYSQNHNGLVNDSGSYSLTPNSFTPVSQPRRWPKEELLSPKSFAW